jgi:small subunit ribosomal protein S6e
MAVFKFVISHQKSSVQVEKDQKDAPIIGKKIGDKISGEFLGLSGYELEICGGSDKDGFPMHRNVDGQIRKKQILTDGHGFHAGMEGMRKRRIVRGNTIAADIAQVNCKVVKAGEKDMYELLGVKPKEKKVKEKKEETNEKKEANAPVAA